MVSLRGSDGRAGAWRAGAGVRWLAFRSRVTGVYLSIITQALTYALLLAFFRNDMGFGGNNGLTDFKDILGFMSRPTEPAPACWSCRRFFLCGQFLVARFVVNVPFRQNPHRGA